MRKTLNLGRNYRLLIFLIVAASIVITWRLLATSRPGLSPLPYHESFDEPGTWTVGEGASSSGFVTGGVYEMSIDLSGDIFWATAGEQFADGIFEVSAVAVEGTEDNGYGMLIRVDRQGERFYVFKVSSDGYVYIGICREKCADVDVLVGRDWFPSDSVRQGLGAVNRLRVEADGPEMSFFVNEGLVGQIVDEALSRGDIGLMAELFTPGGLTVAFDDFSVVSLSEGG